MKHSKPIYLECETCGETFRNYKPSRKNKRFCSVKCANIGHRKVRPKIICSYHLCDNILSGYQTKYCSSTCSNLARLPRSEESKNNSRLATLAYIELVGKKNYPCSHVSFGICRTCSITFRKPHRSNNYCSIKCKEKYHTGYRAEATFRFNPFEYPEAFDTELIIQFNWYSSKKGNIQGITIDHLYRVIDGYMNKIPASVLRHPANAELVPWSENQRRSKKSTITLDELIIRIILWNSGFRNLKRYYNPQ